MEIKIHVQRSHIPLNQAQPVYYIRATMSIGTVYNTNRQNWAGIRQFVAGIAEEWNTTPRVFWCRPDEELAQELHTEEDWVFAILSDS